MGTRRIKLGIKKKRFQIPPISMRDALLSQLSARRNIRKRDEESQVNELIKDGSLDLTKVEDYKYIAGVARGIGFSVGRLKNTIERIAPKKIEEKE